MCTHLPAFHKLSYIVIVLQNLKHFIISFMIFLCNPRAILKCAFKFLGVCCLVFVISNFQFSCLMVREYDTKPLTFVEAGFMACTRSVFTNVLCVLEKSLFSPIVLACTACIFYMSLRVKLIY